MAFFHPRLIFKLKCILSFEDMEKVVHDVVSSRLDYCNMLYLGLNQLSLSLYHVQLVQNSAARLLTERAYTPELINCIGYLYDTEFITMCCCMFSRLYMVYN